MNHIELGRIGESKVEEYLEKLDYEIWAKNFRVGQGEIDLIAYKDNILAFVEVKTRRGYGFGRPCEAVNHYKRQHLIYTAQCFLQHMGSIPDNIRFDVAEVIYKDLDDIEVNYIKNAFYM